jgi:hypothetical protein
MSDPAENTVSNNSFIVVFVNVAAQTCCHVLLTVCYRAMDDFFWLSGDMSQCVTDSRKPLQAL